MTIYHLIDRNNGCRLLKKEDGDEYVTIKALDEVDGEELARLQGFDCSWNGEYHLVDLAAALQEAGLKLKEAA